MKKILLCAGSDRNLEALSALIQSIAEADIEAVMSAADARKHISERRDADLVIINTPLKDEQGIKMAMQLSEENSLPVLLITGQESYERFGHDAKARGVAVISRPVDRKIFSAAIEIMLAAGAVVAKLKNEADELRERLEEVKLVNRAKAMLISNLNMTEAQAHRYIEKHAMDMRLSRKIIAQNVLKTYYNK